MPSLDIALRADLLVLRVRRVSAPPLGGAVRNPGPWASSRVPPCASSLFFRSPLVVWNWPQPALVLTFEPAFALSCRSTSSQRDTLRMLFLCKKQTIVQTFSLSVVVLRSVSARSRSHTMRVVIAPGTAAPQNRIRAIYTRLVLHPCSARTAPLTPRTFLPHQKNRPGRPAGRVDLLHCHPLHPTPPAHSSPSPIPAHRGAGVRGGPVPAAHGGLVCG